jgi:hypothetical protein
MHVEWGPVSQAFGKGTHLRGQAESRTFVASYYEQVPCLLIVIRFRFKPPSSECEAALFISFANRWEKPKGRRLALPARNRRKKFRHKPAGRHTRPFIPLLLAAIATAAKGSFLFPVLFFGNVIGTSS